MKYLADAPLDAKNTLKYLAGAVPNFTGYHNNYVYKCLNMKRRTSDKNNDSRRIAVDSPNYI